MRFLPGNAQNVGARSSQQDSFGFADPDDTGFISHGGFLAVVCDGMGGMEHGDAASKTAVRAFLDAYHQKSPAETIPAALERSARTANDQVVALARSMGMVEGIGTTLVGVALHETSMYFISVGDSGIFLVSGNAVRTVNYPHIYANFLDQMQARGEITREAALMHPERESLTSFIGTEVLQEIDHNVEPLLLEEGDTVLLASDGMFKTLSTEEITACLRGDAVAWPESLVRQTLAKQREFQDNVTVLSVTLESDERSSTPRTLQLPPTGPVAASTPVSTTGMLEGLPLPVAAPPSMPPAAIAPTAVPTAIPPTVVSPVIIPPTVTLPAAAAPLPFVPPPFTAAPFTPAPAPFTTPPNPAPQTVPPPVWTPAAPAPVLASPPPSTRPAGSRKGGGALWIVGGLLLLSAAGGWWYWLHKPASPAAAVEQGGPRHEQEPRDPNVPRKDPALPPGIESRSPDAVPAAEPAAAPPTKEIPRESKDASKEAKPETAKPETK